MGECVYTEPWVGECGGRIVTEDPPVCEEHQEKTCWCGKQAVRGCNVAGGLVCGRPLCDEHECNQIGSGMTGTGPHSKKGRRQYEEWEKMKSAIGEVIEENPDAADDYRRGDRRSLNYLVGQVIEKTEDSVDLGEVFERLMEELEND